MYRKPEMRPIGTAQARILGLGDLYFESDLTCTDDRDMADAFQDCIDQGLPGAKYPDGTCAL